MGSLSPQMKNKQVLLDGGGWMRVEGICVHLQDCGLPWYLRNVVQHQVHAANGALKAEAPAGVGQQRPAPAGQEETGGPKEQSGLHSSSGGCASKAMDWTAATAATEAVWCGWQGLARARLGSKGWKPVSGKRHPGQSRRRKITLQGRGPQL